MNAKRKKGDGRGNKVKGEDKTHREAKATYIERVGPDGRSLGHWPKGKREFPRSFDWPMPTSPCVKASPSEDAEMSVLGSYSSIMSVHWLIPCCL